MAAQGKRPRRRGPRSQLGNDIREWIMFVVAIFIVIYFAIRGSELNPWWIMLLGSMLGFSMLVAGVQQSIGWRGDSEEGKEEEDDS